jgi:hypothetical protein
MKGVRNGVPSGPIETLCMKTTFYRPKYCFPLHGEVKFPFLSGLVSFFTLDRGLTIGEPL